MRFKHSDVSCDVDVFRSGRDLAIRFYDASKEQEAKDMVNLVIVDPGYGYLCIKFKGDDALLSGYLQDSIFATDACVAAAIDFVENLAPESEEAYIPHHVARVRTTSYLEYNGEY